MKLRRGDLITYRSPALGGALRAGIIAVDQTTSPGVVIQVTAVDAPGYNGFEWITPDQIERLF